MEAELEETQRQLRRSAELIQSAFEGLTALHIRITTAALMRARSGTPGLPGGTPENQAESSTSAGRNTMDPGHDAILLLSSANSSESPAPAAQSDPSSPRRPRITDTTLSNLHTQIQQSTESVRQRANELEELRRVIGRHNQERHRPEAHAATPDTPSLSTSTPSSSWDRPVSAFASSLPATSRRLLLESSFRQRFMDESATSLGAMVSARTASSSAAASSSSPLQISRNTVPLSLPSRPEVSVASSPSPAAARSSASPIPADLVTRLTRLAQAIQQDITRISQQSESLMSWINENRARLDGASPSPSTNNTVATSAVSGDSTPRASPSRLPPLESLTNNLSPRTPPGAPRMRPSSDWGQATAVSAHPMSIRPPPPRSSDLFRAEIRRRGPTVPMSTISLPSDESDGPLARSSRSDPPSSTSTTQDPPGSLSADPELVDAVSRVRGALARARYRRTAEEADREEEPADTRGYRVRRRLNADGDEEVMRVPMRRDSAIRAAWRSVEGDNSPWPVSGIPRFSSRADPPADGEARDRRRRTRRSSLFVDEEQAEDSEWLGAVRRLDALARVARESERPEQRETNPGWGFSQVLPRDEGASFPRQEATPRYPVNLGSWWSSMPTNAQDEEEEDTREESEYERDLAAMRARALALTSSNPPLRTLSGGASTLPPPPPPLSRPLSLLSTTQTTPSSLWNDSNVRVRLRAAVARLDEDVRALEAARERAQSQTTQPQPPQPPASSQSQSQSPARPPRRPQSRFWPFDYRDLVSPSPPLERERERDLDRNGRAMQQAQCGPDGTGAGELERPMWGSPTPFYPSVLPLPLVQEMSTLETRSRAFGGAAKQIARMPRRRTLAGR